MDTVDCPTRFAIRDTLYAIKVLQLRRGDLERKYRAEEISTEDFMRQLESINDTMATQYKEVFDLERDLYQEERAHRMERIMGVQKLLSDPLCRYLYKDRITNKKIKNKITEARFKKDLELDYGRPPVKKGLRFCVITGCRVEEDVIGAARIVPRAFSAEMVDYICGAGTGARLSTSENGLPMCRDLKQAFNKGDIVIVPKNPSDITTNRYMVLVANRDVINQPVYPIQDDVGWTFELGDIDGRELSFPTDYRPRKRFLFFRYLFSVLQRKSKHPEHGFCVMDDLILNNPWPGMAGCLRRAFMLRYAQDICNANRFLIEDLMHSLGAMGEIEIEKRSESIVVMKKVREEVLKSAAYDSDSDESSEEEEEDDDNEDESSQE